MAAGQSYKGFAKYRQILIYNKNKGNFQPEFW